MLETSQVTEQLSPEQQEKSVKKMMLLERDCMKLAQLNGFKLFFDDNPNNPALIPQPNEHAWPLEKINELKLLLGKLDEYGTLANSLGFTTKYDRANECILALITELIKAYPECEFFYFQSGRKIRNTLTGTKLQPGSMINL
jgi:hypothetical protein